MWGDEGHERLKGEAIISGQFGQESSGITLLGAVTIVLSNSCCSDLCMKGPEVMQNAGKRPEQVG